MTDEIDVCQRSIRYAPTDGETGRALPEVHVRCTLTTGHTGFHMGDDLMPFGPWIEPANPPVDPTVSNGREPTACPECGDLCRYDGWGLVHPDGVGIGSCRAVRRGPPEEAEA